MGTICYRYVPDDETNKKIDKDLKSEKEQKTKAERIIALLLLGPGESGKSTIMKQMKLLSEGTSGFTTEDRLAHLAIIKRHILQNMQDLITGAKILQIEITENKDAADRVATFTRGENIIFTPEIVSDIKTLWKNPTIKQILVKRRDLSIKGINMPDCTAYFFDTILESILDPNYIPSDADVIRSRAKTVSVTEQEFLYRKCHFRMIDVGGQKSERKKWLHIFTDIDAVIYCVALSEYDLFLREKSEKNRMEDTLEEFANICSNKHLWRTSIILFFNKLDLFNDKIENVDLNICFPDYTGGCNKDNGLEYVKNKFIKVFEDSNKNHSQAQSRQLYTFVTVGIVTDMMNKVMTSVSEIFFKYSLAAQFGM